MDFKFNKKIYSEDKPDVVFLFHGWQNHRWQFFLLIHRLAKKYCVVAYDYSSKILSNNIKKVVRNIEVLVKDAQGTIRGLGEAHNKFYAVGFSLGSIISNLLAFKSRKISKMCLVTIGAYFENCIQTGKLWKILKEPKHLELLSRIDPKNHISDAKTYLILTKGDQWLPYEEGKLFADIAKPKKLKIYKWLPHPLVIFFEALSLRFARALETI